jgi:hypothetical protein
VFIFRLFLLLICIPRCWILIQLPWQHLQWLSAEHACVLWLVLRHIVPSTRKNLTSCGKKQTTTTTTNCQQVVFALLVPSCQQVWNNLLTVVTSLLILSDLLQGCSNKSNTVMIYNNIVITLCRQPCNIRVMSWLYQIC